MCPCLGIVGSWETPFFPPGLGRILYIAWTRNFMHCGSAHQRSVHVTFRCLASSHLAQAPYCLRPTTLLVLPPPPLTSLLPGPACVPSFPWPSHSAVLERSPDLLYLGSLLQTGLCDISTTLLELLPVGSPLTPVFHLNLCLGHHGVPGILVHHHLS